MNLTIKPELTKYPNKVGQAYVLKAPSQGWLVLVYGNPDRYLGTFKTRREARAEAKRHNWGF